MQQVFANVLMGMSDDHEWQNVWVNDWILAKAKTVSCKIKSLNTLCKIVCRCFRIQFFFFFQLFSVKVTYLFHVAFGFTSFIDLFFFLKKNLALFKWTASSCPLLSLSITSFNIYVLVLLVSFSHLYFKMYFCALVQ